MTRFTLRQREVIKCRHCHRKAVRVVEGHALCQHWPVCLNEVVLSQVEARCGLREPRSESYKRLGFALRVMLDAWLTLERSDGKARVRDNGLQRAWADEQHTDRAMRSIEEGT